MILRLLLTSILLLSVNIVFSQETYYAVSTDDNMLRTIDLTNGVVLNSIPITVSGQLVNKANGLARHPATNDIYCLLHLNGFQNRHLAILDTNTAVATLIGDLGDRFAGIVFNNAGVLHGITGDGAAVPESLYTINTTTAATTLVATLGNGDDGEVISYDPNNNLYYHASGIDVGRVFERLNVIYAVTNIPISGSYYDEATAMVYRGSGSFVLASWERFYDIDLSGNVTAIDTMNFNFSCKGLVKAYGAAGLEEQSNDLTTVFYPNPTNGLLNHDVPELIGEKYIMVDLNGRVVLEGILGAQLDISQLDNGYYFINCAGREFKILKE